MIDAFGLTGYEGVYRQVSEVTLNLLRQNKETLMSVLESFIHDPLVEWGRAGKNHGRNALRQKTNGNEDAKHLIKKIDDRLSGVYNLGEFNRDISTRKKYIPKQKNDLLPLSVPGQVERLIQEATSDENLAQMYIGWMPFL